MICKVRHVLQEAGRTAADQQQSITCYLSSHPLTSDGLQTFLLQDRKTERVHGHVLEPCKISVHVDMTKGTGDVRLQISDVHIRVSPDVIELGAFQMEIFFKSENLCVA